VAAVVDGGGQDAPFANKETLIIYSSQRAKLKRDDVDMLIVFTIVMKMHSSCHHKMSVHHRLEPREFPMKPVNYKYTSLLDVTFFPFVYIALRACSYS
jgi:hypothetical protein